jgi:hypothetical protein
MQGQSEQQTTKVVSFGPDSDIIDAGEAGHWRSVGVSPLEIVSHPNIITDYLGLKVEEKLRYGMSCLALCYLLN